MLQGNKGQTQTQAQAQALDSASAEHLDRLERVPRVVRWPVLKELSRSKGAMFGGIISLAIIVIGLLAPVIAPFDPLQQDLPARLSAPSTDHWFGTDRWGRDVLSWVIWGTRVSFLVGIVAVAASFVCGVSIGMVAGYVGGKAESLLMRLIDILQAFPLLLLAITVMAMLGTGLRNVVIAAAIASTPEFARLAYGTTLSVRQREFVEGAVVAGASHVHIITKHVFPNILAPLIVVTTLRVATVIVLEANLSFIGVGVPPDVPTWGGLVSAGQGLLNTAPWVALPPTIAITIFVLCINLFGDGLRDALDPHVRGR